MQNTCQNCGRQLAPNDKFCLRCGKPVPKPEQITQKFPDNKNIQENVKVYSCPNCGAKAKDGQRFCSSCGTKIVVQSDVHTPTEAQTSNTASVPNVATDTKSTERKVNIKGGKYIGKKWFLKIPYKVYETDVDFSDKFVTFCQWTKASNKTDVQIDYSSIQSVDVSTKYSIPNVIFACIVVLLTIIMKTWIALIIVPVVLFIGRTAVASVKYGSSIYTVPTEFKSEAEELRNKINAAISQSRE